LRRNEISCALIRKVADVNDMADSHRVAKSTKSGLRTALPRTTTKCEMARAASGIV
jgi:hypothetical protein